MVIFAGITRDPKEANERMWVDLFGQATLGEYRKILGNDLDHNYKRKSKKELNKEVGDLDGEDKKEKIDELRRLEGIRKLREAAPYYMIDAGTDIIFNKNKKADCVRGDIINCFAKSMDKVLDFFTGGGAMRAAMK